METQSPVAVSSLPPLPRPRLCGLAVASLILGIMGLGLCVIGPLLGVPAVVCGHIALARVNASGGSLTGRGQAIAGLVTGYLAIVSIVVMAALLLPALSCGRDKARQLSCLSNLRQIGLALMMYSSTPGTGPVPPPGTVQLDVAPLGLGPGPGQSQVLPPDLDAVRPFLGPGADRVLACPSAPAAARGAPGDYEYLGAGLRLAELKRAGQTVLVVESAARHHHGMNILFADGHVQFVALLAGQDWRAAAAANGWVIPGAPAP